MRIGPKHRSESSAAAWVAVLLSLLLHVPFLALFAAFRSDPEVMESTHFDAESEFSIDLVAEAEEPKEPDAIDEEPLRVISADPPEVEETPEDARFADQFESSAEKETARRGLPGAAAQPQPRRPPQPVAIPSPEPAEREEAAQNEASTSPSPPIPEDSTEGVRVQPEPNSAPPRSPAELFPSIASSEAAEMLGESGSIDYLRDVEEGDKTLLNRKRTRYWAFFDRVKRQVSKEWSPVNEYRKRDPFGNVYGVKDRYSTVDVTLNGDGSVRRLYMSRASGLDFFDSEAVRAIQSASPFHNPPEGLKDEDGLVHFTFGFYFEISSGSFRFIRVNN